MKVGDNISKGRANWNFGGNTAETFVDHVSKSVPFYEDGHSLVCALSDFFVSNDSVCYELGTSTGELIKKLSTYNSHKPNTQWIGIDSEAGMIEKASEHCRDIKNINVYHEDVMLHDFDKADFIVSYYTIQFIPERHRQELFKKIFDTLNWGGAFVLFEKVRGPDARFQDMMTALYNDFKSENGFSSEEILNKTQSLKGVLKPFSTEGNLGLFKRAGFIDVMSIMKYVCFEGFIAIK